MQIRVEMHPWPSHLRSGDPVSDIVTILGKEVYQPDAQASTLVLEVSGGTADDLTKLLKEGITAEQVS